MEPAGTGFSPAVAPLGYQLELQHRAITERQALGAERTAVLCRSCRWGMVARPQNASEPLTMCGQWNKRVPNTIVECTRYMRMGMLTLSEMADLAYDVGGQRRPGFLRERDGQERAE